MGNDLVESNYEQVVLDLLARVKRLEGAGVTASELSEISSDIGLIEGGELRIHSDWADPKEPGDGFSGVRILGSFEYPAGSGDYYAIVGVNNDALTFGLSAIDGSAIFCSGNATIDQDGISGTDLLKWMIEQTATNGANTRTGKLGMALQEGGGTIPNWELSYESPAGTELVTNGGAETGDFTGWTKTTGNWSAITTYMATGTYSFNAQSSTSVLTSDRFAITANLNYLCSLQSMLKIVLGSGSAAQTVKMEVKFWDALSGGSQVGSTELIDTFSHDSTSGEKYSSGWRGGSFSVNAPSGATHMEVVLTYTASGTGILAAGGYFDDISVSEIAVSQKLHLTDDGLATTNGMFPHSASMFPEECIATAALTYALNAAQIYAHYAYIVQASANDGDEYVYTCMLDKGTYTLDYLYVKGTSGGKADIYVDDVKVVSLLDHYNSSVAYNQRSTTTSISVTYSGRHEIKLKVNGKHASSADYCLTHTKITMRRTGA